MKYIKLFFYIIIPLVVLSGAIKNTMSQEQKNELKTDYYFLKVETSDVIVSININDAPVMKILDSDSVNSIIPVNAWLIRGDNTLSINISPPIEERDDYPPDVALSMFLHDSASETPLPKKVLAMLEYKSSDNTDKEIMYPLKRSLTFEFSESIKNNLWSNSTDIKIITDEDKKNIVNLINSLTVSLINNDVDNAVKLQSYKINEEALSVNKSPAEVEKAVRSTYEWLGKQVGLTGEPLVLDDLIFTICGKNKLVYVTKTNNSEAISFSSDEIEFELEVFVANINGNWTIAR